LTLTGGRGRKKFRFKNKLVSLDSSVIDLCLSMYDWAKFRTTKGAIKLHLRPGREPWWWHGILIRRAWPRHVS
jgi:hypothetical protein